jgi:hypothetical protein
MTPSMDANEAYKARQAAMARIEQESLEKTGLRSDVVTLYGGAKYHLYRYKKYTDVRLVWAPEADAANFGGDPDNFEYPRYCLDVALVRVYDDGKPALIEDFLQWSNVGVADGELVFVCGNPANTQRSTTVAALKCFRDRRLPYGLDYLCRMEVALQQFGGESPEHRRRAQDDLSGVQNSRKALTGMQQGLQTPTFMERKMQAERSMRAKLKADPRLRHYEDAWQRIAEIQDERADLLGRLPDFDSRYYELAKNLVLMATEDQKPSEDRLREFRKSARESFELQLFSPAPIYDDLEAYKLGHDLEMFAELRGGDDSLVVEILAGKSPRERAAELVGRSTLNKVEVRRQLAEGGEDAIRSSDDPLIQLFRNIEPEYRKLLEKQEELDEIQRQAYTEIEEAKVALEGTSGYPDATFTLRLVFGIVKGYEEEGRLVRPWTTMGGAFEHEATHDAEEPWRLPPSWHKARKQIDPATPLNFVSTADIIGGNSGSPVVNSAGGLVGVIFDSNIQGLTASFFYDDELARAISVSSSAVREALRNIYGAAELADQLGR